MDKLREPRYLDAARVELRLDDSGHLQGKPDGTEEMSDLRAREAFPYSMPGKYVELRTGAGEFVGFIRSLDDLSAEVRTAIQTSMRYQHFVPRVERIRSIKSRFGLYTWQVITDRGEAEFTTRGRRQNIEQIGRGEYVVTGSDGNRYRIPCVRDLDPRSLVQLRKVL